jgi:murein L,D-transpeptidase YafK
MIHRVTLLLMLCSLLPLQAPAQDEVEPWVVIDTRQQALKVMVGDHIEQIFAGISVGRGGTAKQRFQGDGRTPKGVFRIGWINPRSKYHLFFGLDYPNLDHAERAFASAQIDFDTYYQISSAVLHGQTPPQNTPLGGYIGIHGLGSNDPRIHKTLNWTQGCIALTNEQIEQLARWVNVGTRVVIL